MVHSFLLIGQSNMAGRGFIKEAVPVDTSNIKVLRNGRWQPMYRPINCDRGFAGVSLAESFAEKYAKEHNCTVGLIGCADGGVTLNHWQPGEALFENAVYMCKLAMRSSTIAGVLWHQGEGDCTDGRWQVYGEKCRNMFEALRRELDLYDVPFLVGGLGDFLPLRGKEINQPKFNNYNLLNGELEKLAQSTDYIGYVSARGLTANPDNLHFNSKSLYEFGLRYYSAFEKLEKKDKIFTEKGSNLDYGYTRMEQL